MRPKTKIILSAISLVLVFTLGIIGVFALTQINTDAKLRVKFVSQKNVYATVSAKSYKSSQEAPIETLRPLVIDGSEDDGYEGSLAFSNLIEVTQAETIDYVFEIKNTTEVVTNPELVIEPIIEFADDFATWTIYYMADREVGYKQLSNLAGTGDSYTYVELAKGESVRIRLSINSTNSEEDVELDDSTMSFRLYTATTAPTGYSDDAVVITDSHLYYEVGDTVSLGKYPTTAVDETLNAAIIAEYEKYYYDNDPNANIRETGEAYNHIDYVLYVYEYEGVEYLYNEYNGSTYTFEPVEFTVVETEDGAVTLFADKVYNCSWYAPTYNYYGDFVEDVYSQTGYALSDWYDWFVSEAGIEDIVLETTIENVTYDGSPDKESTVKSWAPLERELNAWAEVLGDDIINVEYTQFSSTRGYDLRDGFKIEQGEDGLLCYVKFVDHNNKINEYGSDEMTIETGMGGGVRPVCRINQLDYKGF